jgi:hypothetical protein
MRRPGEFGVGLSPPPHRAAAPSYAPLHRLGELRDRSRERQQGRASRLTCLYSPECVEGSFSELPLYGILRTSEVLVSVEIDWERDQVAWVRAAMMATVV